MKKPLPLKRVHFIGIGGIGTSALSRWFLAHNYQVSGSDSDDSLITKELKKEGVKIFIGHRPENLSEETRLIIRSVAISSDNPELKKAQSLKIPIKLYSEAIGDLIKQYKTLAVSGSHGKSTTSALLSLVLINAGFDPTVIIGTRLKEFKNSNFRKGESPYLILEADEYHHSFLNYSPSGAIITNIDREHLDYYKNLTAIKNVFLKFIGNIQQNGILIVNKDDKNLFSLKNKIQKIGNKNNLKIFWYSARVNLRLNLRLSASLKIFGKHNISNSLAVYTLAKTLKIKDKDIFKAFSSYYGAWRRMEYKGELKVPDGKAIGDSRWNRDKNQKFPMAKPLGILDGIGTKVKSVVYDDYAHHPTEIKATLSGFRQKYPESKIICVFQPHQIKRLEALFKEFTKAFDEADTLILLPVFQVHGRDKLSQNINSEKLTEAVKKRINSKFKIQNSKLRTIIYLPCPEKLKEVINQEILNFSSLIHNSITIVLMGAGDIYKMTDNLIK